MLSPEIDEHDWRAVRDRLILVMLYECGLRRSELAGLKDQAVDTQARQLKVLGKGRKERIVPFGEGLASAQPRSSWGSRPTPHLRHRYAQLGS